MSDAEKPNTSKKSMRARTLDHMTVPRDLKDPSTFRRFAHLHLIYSLAGLVLGLACILGGIVLALHGITGSTSWTASFIGTTSEISDAGPGVVLFVVGLFIVWVTRFSIAVQK